MKKFLNVFFRAAILVAMIAPIAFVVIRQWGSVSSAILRANWGTILVGMGWLMLGLPLMGLISWLVLNDLDARQPLPKVTMIYFISQAAKYLPGGIWAFPGRVVAYQAVGVKHAAALVSMIREVAALFLGAAITGLLGLAVGLPVAPWMQAVLGVGVGACVLGVLAAQMRLFWRFGLRIPFIKRYAVEVLSLEGRYFSLRWLPPAVLTSLAFWAVTGLGFQMVVAGATNGAAHLGWLQAASVFALAWCVGFVVVVAPAGLGVRESALSALLAQSISLSDALSVALISRLWWTAAEAGFILVAALWLARRADLASLVAWRRKPPAPPPSA
jgi:uncharacterized membrane protein YbhN (UPF0104 family)